MKIRLALLSTSAIVLFVITPFAANALQEPQERTIRRLPIERNEPLSITSVRVNGKTVSSGKEFVADDDWLRSLVISVKNKSDKLILFASIQLLFPRPPGSQEKMSVTDMSYGNLALQRRPPTPDERLVGIAPGETVEIKLSVQQFVDLGQFLAATGFPQSIEKVDLRIGSVIFEDDTMWSRGAHLRRDPKNSGTWVNLELTSPERK